MNIVLLEPEIPSNTGNIGRTCLLTDSTLHLIKPLGFTFEDKHLKRAGMDYWPDVKCIIYENLEEFYEKNQNGRFFYATTKTKQKYCDVNYKKNLDFVKIPKKNFTKSLLVFLEKRIGVMVIHLSRNLHFLLKILIKK